MDIEPHHVTQAAREEQGVGSCFGSLGGVALHQPQFLHTTGNLRSGGNVGLAEGTTGLQLINGSPETAQVDVIDLGLTVSKPLADGHRRREVAGIVRTGLGSSVEQEDVAVLQVVNKAVVMEYLSLYGGDSGESQRSTRTASHLLDGSSHLRLMNAGAHGAVGSKVHFRAQVHRLLDEAYLLVGLVVALADDGLDEGHAGLRRLCGRLHARQLPKPDAVVATIGRQEVDWFSTDDCCQFIHRPDVGNTYGSGHLAQRGLGTRPDDVVDGQLIAEDDFAVLIDVDDGGQSGVVEAEEIKERGVLTETVGVVGIIHRCLVVAEEEQQAAAHVALQLGAATDIGFFLHRFAISRLQRYKELRKFYCH